MAARLGDLAKAFDDFVLIFDVGPRNGRQAHDGVHRRPDVVGHIGEEIRLGAACVLGRAVRFLQRLVGFDLGLFLLRHIHRRQQNFDQLRAVPLQRDERRDLIRVFVQCAVFKFVDVVLALQIPADIFRRDERIQCVQRFQCLILCNDLLHKTMVGPGRRIDPFTLQVIELIAVIFQIADDEAVQQAHHALDQQLHGCVGRGHLHPPRRLGFALCDVPQKDHRIVRVPDLAAHDHVADPPLFAVQEDAAFLAQLGLKPLQFFGDVGAVVELRDLLFVLFDHIVVHKEFDQLVPCLALLKGRHQGVLHLEGIEGVLFQIHIIFAEVRAGEGAVERFRPLRLHPALLFFLNVPDDAGDAAGRAIQTADHFRRGPEPLVLAVFQPQPVLHAELCGVGLVGRRFKKQRHHPVFVLRVQKLRPRIQLVREIQSVMIPQDLPEGMAPIRTDDPALFIAFKVPRCRVDGLVDQRKVFIRPIHLHRQHPERPAVRVHGIFLIKMHVDRCSIGCEDLALPCAPDLTKALRFEEADVFPIKQVLQRTLRLLHQGRIAVVQVMQQQFADRQDRQARIIVPGHGPDAAILMDRVLHRLKHVLSQFFRIGCIDLIRKSIVELHFHPRTCSNLPCVPASPDGIR